MTVRIFFKGRPLRYPRTPGETDENLRARNARLSNDLTFNDLHTVLPLHAGMTLGAMDRTEIADLAGMPAWRNEMSIVHAGGAFWIARLLIFTYIIVDRDAKKVYHSVD